MKKRFFSTATACFLLMTACQWQSAEKAAILANPLECFGEGYRNDLADFRAKYPQELHLYKTALIDCYAGLPEAAYGLDNHPQDRDMELWVQFVKAGKLNALPIDRRQAPGGMLIALWEEIAAETDAADTPENLRRRKAICNLYNYELAHNDCSMPPSIQHYIPAHIEHANIICIPHSDEKLALRGYDRYVRPETLSPKHQQVARWYKEERAKLFNNNEWWTEKQKTLLQEYHRRLNN